MELLILRSNDIEGNIPPELANLTNLTHLELDSNQLTGPIPCQLGTLGNLETLNLNNNQLSGNIPFELGGLVNLTSLKLSSNLLAGSIPSTLGNLTSLSSFFSLDNNNLTGCFPDEINIHCGNNYQLHNNPGLPWQGDFDMWCDGEPQIGAPCDDKNPNTSNDAINANCDCVGEAQLCLMATTFAIEPFLSLEKGPDNKEISGVFDIDGDGDRDVVTMTQQNSVVEILIYENGALTQLNQFSVPDFVHWFNILKTDRTRHFEESFFQDFNNDGIKDLLFSFSSFQNCSGNKIRVYWGDRCSSKLFEEGNYTELFTSSSGCYVAFAEDFDQDGDVDIYADRRLFGSPNYFFENDSFGNFTQVPASNTYIDYVFYFLDFTGDGFKDQIGNSRNSNNGFYIKEGDQTTNFQEIHNDLLGKSLGSESILDWDNDNDLEFLFQNLTDFPQKNRIEVVNWNEPAGVEDSFINVQNNSTLIEIEDWNLDGLKDIFTCESIGPDTCNLAVYINDGQSGFDERQLIVENAPYRFWDVFDFTGTGDFKVRALSMANDSTFLFSLIPPTQYTEIYEVTCDTQQTTNTSSTFVNQFGCDSIATTYTSMLGPISSEGLIAYFAFDDDSLEDWSGWDQDGIEVGNNVFEAGQRGNSISICDTFNYATLPSSILNEVTDFSISFWFKLKAFNTMGSPNIPINTFLLVEVPICQMMNFDSIIKKILIDSK